MLRTEATAMFHSMDINSDGTLDSDEIAAALSEMGFLGDQVSHFDPDPAHTMLKLTSRTIEADALLFALDANSDGLINEKEFVDGFETIHRYDKHL